MEAEEKAGSRGNGETAEVRQDHSGRRGLSRSTIVWIYYCLLAGVLLFVAIIAVVFPIFLTVEAGIEVAVAVAVVEFVVIVLVFAVLFYKADLISQCPLPENSENLKIEPV